MSKIYLSVMASRRAIHWPWKRCTMHPKTRRPVSCTSPGMAGLVAVLRRHKGAEWIHQGLMSMPPESRDAALAMLRAWFNASRTGRLPHPPTDARGGEGT